MSPPDTEVGPSLALGESLALTVGDIHIKSEPMSPPSTEDGPSLALGESLALTVGDIHIKSEPMSPPSTEDGPSLALTVGDVHIKSEPMSPPSTEDGLSLALGESLALTVGDSHIRSEPMSPPSTEDWPSLALGESLALTVGDIHIKSEPMSPPSTEDGPSLALGESEPMLPLGTENRPSLDMALGSTLIKSRPMSPSGTEECHTSSAYKSVESFPNPVGVLTVHGRPSSLPDVDNGHLISLKPYSLASCRTAFPPPSTSKAISTNASLYGTSDYGVDEYNSESRDGSFVSRANMPEPESALDSASESQRPPLGTKPRQKAPRVRKKTEKSAEINRNAARRYRQRGSQERRKLNKELAALTQMNTTLKARVEQLEQAIFNHKILLQGVVLIYF